MYCITLVYILKSFFIFIYHALVHRYARILCDVRRVGGRTTHPDTLYDTSRRDVRSQRIGPRRLDAPPRLVCSVFVPVHLRPLPPLLLSLLLQITGDHVVLSDTTIVSWPSGYCAEGHYTVRLWYALTRADRGCANVTLRYNAPGTSPLEGPAAALCLNGTADAHTYAFSAPVPVVATATGPYSLHMYSAASGTDRPLVKLVGAEVAAAPPEACDFATAETQAQPPATVFCGGTAQTAGGDFLWRTPPDGAPGPAPPPPGPSTAYAYVASAFGFPHKRAFLTLGDGRRGYWGVRFQYFVSAPDAGSLAVEVCDASGCAGDAAPALWRTVWRVDSAHHQTLKAAWQRARVFWQVCPCPARDQRKGAREVQWWFLWRLHMPMRAHAQVVLGVRPTERGGGAGAG